MNQPAPTPNRPQPTKTAAAEDPLRPGSDWPFLLVLGLIGGFYLLVIVALIVADSSFTTPHHLWAALRSREIQYAIKLSCFSSTLTMLFSVIVAVPIGYLMSRYPIPAKTLLDAILDIPIVLPPLVIGLSLLILFRTPVGRAIEWVVPVTYEIPGVILAQFMVACAFAVRTMRAVFDQINPRREQVALTLGCRRSQAFWRVVLPEARRGLLTAASLAWARSLGEFGPVLIFAGATRMRTEVLPTTIFLELSVGNLEAAVAVSLLMVGAAVAVLVLINLFGIDPFLKSSR